MPATRLLPVVACVLIVSSSAAPIPKVDLLRTPDNGIQPQAAVDANGTVHLIYYKGEPTEGDVFYTRRKANEKDFSPAIRVNSQIGSVIAAGSIRGAQLAIGKNGRVHVVWDGMGKGAEKAVVNGKEESPLLYTRIDDSGIAFEPERNVITSAFGLDGGSSVAADAEGNVYVMWHASKPGNTEGEAGRAVFVSRSTDEGRTFTKERPAIDKPTGACGCCGMKAFADSAGNVYALYRAATAMTNRSEVLLVSKDRARTFDIAYSHHWAIGTCPMSSSFLSESPAAILASAETHGRVFFIRHNPKTGTISSPISPERKAKHPIAISNHKGEVLFAWTEGTAWAKGGNVVWRVYDAEGAEMSQPGNAEGVPPWSLVTAFSTVDGNFTIVY
jgi:hypothetical protein